MDLAFDVVYGRDNFTIANSHIKIDCRRGDRFVWDERPAPLQLVVSGDQPYTTSQQIVVSYKSEYYDYLCISYEYAPGAGGSGAGCLEIRYGDEDDPCAADAPRIWRFRSE